MTLLPILSRELRVASRRRATYWVRSGAGLVVIGVGTWWFIVTNDQNPKDIALGLFYILTGSAVLYALFSGLRTTADCLSEEKREGTLGLLFLTDLKGYDVVLGKLMASSVNALYSVVAILPMLAIPLLMGGITPGEFARMALLSLNALFFSLAAGIWVSSFSRSGYHAMLGTFLVILCFTALLPAGGAILSMTGKVRQVPTAFLLPSAAFTYYGALDQVYRTTRMPFGISMGIIHSLGWIFLALASFTVPRTWQEGRSGMRGQRWTQRFTVWRYGPPAERAELRRRLLSRNPFFWLSSRVRLRPAVVWAFLGVVACIWVWGLAKARREWLQPHIYLSTGLLLNFFIRCYFAAEATRQIAEDRKSGTLELLLSTPLQVREILHGQILGLLRQFLAPVLVVLGVECLFMAASVADSGGESAAYTFWTYTAGMVMFVLDLVAIYWIGIWQGLSARSQSRAISTTLARVLILPWLVIALVLLVLALISMSGVNQPDPGGWFFLALWFFTGLFIDLGFAAAARHQLLTQFRAAAQERFGARPGFWKSLFARR